MKNQLRYLLVNSHNKLFAYGAVCEFFEMYDASGNVWSTSGISYSGLLHDCDYIREISREEAIKITGGNLPENAYRDYCKLFGVIAEVD